jgi:hypothetical protein
MPTLHDPTFHSSVRNRLETLVPDAPRQWGKMNISQMLWHISEALEMSLGRREILPEPASMPRPILRFVVLNAPWPKGAPTLRPLRAVGKYDFVLEKARALRLVDEMASRELAGRWPDQPRLGKMSGADWSRLMAKHVDHHLRQFGA